MKLGLIDSLWLLLIMFCSISISGEMAGVPICYKMPSKGHNFPIQKALRQHERCLMCDCLAFRQGSRFQIFPDSHRRCQVLHPASSDIVMKLKIRGGVNSPGEAKLNQEAVHFQNMTDIPALHKVSNTKGENSCMVWYASTGTSEKQLRLLDSYFGKLQGNANQASSDSCKTKTELHDKSGQINAKEELEHLDSYLGKLNKGKISCLEYLY